MTDLDPKLTFDAFVVGPANRLASAAARRAADSPGTSYNPLFLYSASGLGKSHILAAISHQAIKSEPDRKVEYMALEKYLEEFEAALESGTRDAFKDKYSDLEILLLDDVQFLTGQVEAQEMLLRTLDQLSTAGSQIVLASDRPPADIDGLDARLLSRFSGGLIVDIGAPEYETRVAIIRKKADERDQKLDAGVAEALARVPFKNVRELGGALNKVFATQDLEERQVTADEVTKMVGAEEVGAPSGPVSDEFGAFLEDLAETVAETVDEKEEPWRKAIRHAIDSAEREASAVAGDLDYAVAVGREGMGLYPDSGPILVNTGAVFERRGEVDAAEALYKRAVAVTPAPAQAHKNLGDQAYAHGDHDAARIQYEKAVKLSPRLGDDIYLRLGTMAYKDNDRDVALLLWRRALDLNPHNEAVSSNLELLSGE